MSATEIADVERYEGNAQGFRILTRLQMPDNNGGLQLTFATLGAFTKYPHASLIAPVDHQGTSLKKFGYFQAEREHFASIAEKCGLISRGPECWARHPLVFLVEAADDICYRLVDFEDGFRLGHLTYEEVRTSFSALIPQNQLPQRLDSAQSHSRRVQILRDVAIGSAIEQTADLF